MQTEQGKEKRRKMRGHRMLLLLMPFHFAAIRPFLVPTEQKKQQAQCTFSHAEQQQQRRIAHFSKMATFWWRKMEKVAAVQRSRAVSARQGKERKSTLEFGE